MQNNEYNVDILINGKPVRKFAHEGKTFIQANRGSHYSIKVKNNSHYRRMFVVSVDGINVVNGKPAGSYPIGYVLGGYSSYEINGFRTSNEKVNAFKFGDKSKSYAAKSDETKGDVSNCGVIGLQVYEEKEKEIKITYIPSKPFNFPNNQWETTFYCNSSEPTASGASYTMSSNSGPTRSISSRRIQAQNSLLMCCSVTDSIPDEQPFQAGTEFSEALESRVTDTTFDTGKLLSSIEVFYDYREGLVKMGVPITKEVKVAMPSAFPVQFCKPPKG